MEVKNMNSFRTGKAELTGNSEFPYLDSTELVEGMRFKRVAFAVNNSSGVDKRSMGYFTFYLKSVDNSVITGRLFDVIDFIDGGFTAKLLIHKPVLIDFTPQVYLGRWSLILHDIKLWDGAFNRNAFISSLNVNTSFIEQMVDMCGVYSQIEQWKKASFAELGDFNIGAFAVLADSTLRKLYSYEPLWDIDITDLMTIGLIALDTKFRYYELLAEYPIIRPEDRLNLVNSKVATYRDSPLKDIVLDVVMAILDGGKPHHLYAVLVHSTIESSIKDIKTVYVYKSMPKGATAYYEGSELIKY